MVGARRRGRAGDAGGDAGDVRAVERRVGIDGEAPGCARVRAGEDARDDHLRRRPLRAAPREAGGVREAGRIEERVRLVDAVVDDRDLDARCRRRRSRARSTSAPMMDGERSSASVYVDARIDLRRPTAARRSAGASRPGSDTVSASSTIWKRRPIARLRDRGADLCGGTRLLRVERRRYARDADARRRACARDGRERAAAPPRARAAARRGDDDAHACVLPAGSRTCPTRTRGPRVPYAAEAGRRGHERRRAPRSRPGAGWRGARLRRVP